MHWVLANARDHFEDCLRRFAPDVPALASVVVDTDARSGDLIFRATFSRGGGYSWILPGRRFRTAPLEFIRNPETELRRLWSELAENRYVGRDVQRELARLARMEMLGAPHDAIQAQRHRIEQMRDHAMRHHGWGRPPAPTTADWRGVHTGGPRGESNSGVVSYRGRGLEVVAFDEIHHDDGAFAALRERVDGEMRRAFFGADWGSSDVGDGAANRKGLALLREWLSPAQLAQYDDKTFFDVVGSDTGKRYRIRHGRQMNIDELDADGRKVCGWCFLPEGQLVAGDVMLAQKIALETNERKALKVANRFDAFEAAGAGLTAGSLNLYPGGINWISS